MASATNTSATGLDPIVIVTSLGAVPAKEIINSELKVHSNTDLTSTNTLFMPSDIRQIPYTDDQLRMDEDHIGLRYAVVTKYYTSRIQFVHYDGALETLPQNMQDSVEGILVYFDAQNVRVTKSYRSLYINYNPRTSRTTARHPQANRCASAVRKSQWAAVSGADVRQTVR